MLVDYITMYGNTDKAQNKLDLSREVGEMRKFVEALRYESYTGCSTSHISLSVSTSMCKVCEHLVPTSQIAVLRIISPR